MAALSSIMKLAKIGWLLWALLTLLVLQRSCQPVAAPAPSVVAAAPGFRLVPVRDTSRGPALSLGRKALPKSRWHSVPGPAYLVYPLPRRPRQAQLDIEAARAAQLHKI